MEGYGLLRCAEVGGEQRHSHKPFGKGGGSGNGRILWATADDIADSIVDEIQAATDVAAKHIEKNMGSV